MVTSFLIGTLVFFSLNMILSLISIGVNSGSQGSRDKLFGAIVSVFIMAILITWNILALFAY